MTEFETFRRDALADKITASILAMIRDERLSPGDKLPPERELASLMGVSRPSLREALRALSIMNVVEMRQGDGTYVTSLEPDLLVEHLDFVFDLNDATFLEVFYVRKLLEVGIVALAAERITNAELAELATYHNEMVAAHQAGEPALLLDQQFHIIITKAARHPILSHMMRAIRRLDLASRTRLTQTALPDIREPAIRDHAEILQALQSRDAAAAQAAMEAHLVRAEVNLQRAINLEQESE